MSEVYIVLDNYAPDAGSRIYGIFSTWEKANAYLTKGIFEDYGADHEVDSVEIEEHTLI